MKKIFIGIDFSKEKFDATLIQAEGLKECAPSVHEVFDNKTSGFRHLVKWVKTHAEDLTADLWLFCGENTGGYSIGLCNYLYASGYDMWLECAYNIKHSAGIQRVKNDRVHTGSVPVCTQNMNRVHLLSEGEPCSYLLLGEEGLNRLSASRAAAAYIRQRV